MNIIPAIDLLDGRCVRLLHGDYDKVTHYDLDPVELARQYSNAGARNIHIVDLDGARAGSGVHQSVVAGIAAIENLTVQSGGGVRSKSDLEQRFNNGIDRVVLGSLAVTEPENVIDWLAEFGADRLVLALDIRFDEAGVPMLATHGWKQQTSTSLWDLINSYGDNLQHVLCTDIGRDGAMSGPNLELYGQCVKQFPHLKFQASGGVRNIDDATALLNTGVDGMITGKALLEGNLTIEELKPFLPNV